jgi:hypothetical protein
MIIDERLCDSPRAIRKQHYNSLPRTYLEAALGAIYGLLTLVDPNLTLTRTQHTAIVSNLENRKPFTHARFASLCNPQQPLTAHS